MCLLVLQPLGFAGRVEWPWPNCFDAHVLSTSQSKRQVCWVMQNDIRSSASSQVACPLSGVAKIWTLKGQIVNCTTTQTQRPMSLCFISLVWSETRLEHTRNRSETRGYRAAALVSIHERWNYIMAPNRCILPSGNCITLSQLGPI